MTDTPAHHPVTAWAVVDKADNLYLGDMFPEYDLADAEAKWNDTQMQSRAPHRVVRVEIKVVGEG